MRDELANSEDKRWLDAERDRLSQFLLRLRTKRKLNLEKAGLDARLNNKTLSRIESGKFMPRYATLLHLAKGFEMTPAQFFRELARFLDRRGPEAKGHCVRRYYSRDKLEWVELWRRSAAKKTGQK